MSKASDEDPPLAIALGGRARRVRSNVIARDAVVCCIAHARGDEDAVTVARDHVAVGGCIPTDDVIRGVVDIHAGSDHSVWRAIRSQTEEVAGDRAPGAVHFDPVVEASMNGQTPDRAATRADQKCLRAGAAFAIQLDQDVCIIANG